MISREELVSELASSFQDAAGCDEPPADANLVDWMIAEAAWGDFDLADWIFRIERQLAIHVPMEEWKAHFGGLPGSHERWATDFKPRWTLNGFAGFLLGRLPPVRFESVNIAGLDSLPAGVFLGMQDLAAHIDRDAEPFGPGSEIVEALHGRTLQRFWGDLRLLTGVTLPRLTDRPEVAAGWLWAVASALVLAVSCVGFRGADLCFGFGFTCVASQALGKLVFWITGRIGPHYGELPHGLRTFRDLALHVSERLGGRESKVAGGGP